MANTASWASHAAEHSPFGIGVKIRTKWRLARSLPELFRIDDRHRRVVPQILLPPCPGPQQYWPPSDSAEDPLRVLSAAQQAKPTLPTEV